MHTLDLSSLILTDSDAVVLRRCLRAGGLSTLSVLNISGIWSKLTAVGLSHILHGLINGDCHKLGRLDLVGSCLGKGGGHVLAAAFMTGHFLQLEELEMSGTKVGVGGFEAIAGALGKGCCPALRRLELSGCLLSARDGQALGPALAGGACARLEMLGLSGSPNMGDRGLVPILQALASGGCSGLRRLDLEGANMTSVGGSVFAHALHVSGVPDLQWLQLYRAFKDPMATLQVLEAVRLGRCPRLHYLDLMWTEVGVEHCRVLGEAMTAGALSQLELLR